MLDLTPDELLTTTRAVRKRLDFDRPVDLDVVRECLEIAIQAPTGSNAQGWHWVVVTDPDTKMALADLYRDIAGPYLAAPAPNFKEGDTRADRMEAVTTSAQYLAAHLHEAPVFVIPCMWGRPESIPHAGTLSGWYGSIFPAVWNLQLALRARGLGTSLTTLHLGHEKEAAELLGIPYEHVTQVALLPIAHTKGTDFKPAVRNPIDDILHLERW